MNRTTSLMSGSAFLVMDNPLYVHLSRTMGAHRKYVAGDVNLASSYTRADLPAGLSDRFDWLGLVDYKKGVQMVCNVVNGAPVCNLQ